MAQICFVDKNSDGCICVMMDKFTVFFESYKTVCPKLECFIVFVVFYTILTFVLYNYNFLFFFKIKYS